MTTINIKPLSVNQAWKGRRFKTDDYNRYQRNVLLMLPKSIIIPDGKLKITLIFGFSSKASDTDNPVKPFQDILSKKYNFNDKMIYELLVKKVDVSKGSEFIQFKIESLNC